MGLGVTADPEAILIFEAHGIGSNCWPWRLKFHMAEININLIHSIVYNITFQVYTRSSQDILILMFCTSLRQCKADVGCICLTAILRKLVFCKKFSSQNFWSHNDSICNQLNSSTEVKSFEVFWHKISVKLCIFMTLSGIPKGLSKKWKIQTRGEEGGG